MLDEKTVMAVLEVALANNGDEVTRMSELIGQPSRVCVLPNQIDAHSFFAIDLTFGKNGAIVLQEANGSNEASTGMLLDGQVRRARHMCETAIARGGCANNVVLLPHANKTGLRP